MPVGDDIRDSRRRRTGTGPVRWRSLPDVVDWEECVYCGKPVAAGEGSSTVTQEGSLVAIHDKCRSELDREQQSAQEK